MDLSALDARLRRRREEVLDLEVHPVVLAVGDELIEGLAQVHGHGDVRSTDCRVGTSLLRLVMLRLVMSL